MRFSAYSLQSQVVRVPSDPSASFRRAAEGALRHLHALVPLQATMALLLRALHLPHLRRCHPHQYQHLDPAWQVLGSLDSFGRCTLHEQSLHAVQVPAHGRQYQGGIATICDANKSPAMPSDVSKSTVAPWPNSVAAHSASPPPQATDNALPNALLEECAI